MCLYRRHLGIACRDALLDAAETAEVEWPEATVIVGNPPFLGGGKRMRAGLGDSRIVQSVAERAYRLAWEPSRDGIRAPDHPHA